MWIRVRLVELRLIVWLMNVRLMLVTREMYTAEGPML